MAMGAWKLPRRVFLKKDAFVRRDFGDKPFVLSPVA
jgi:hypothetical protein